MPCINVDNIYDMEWFFLTCTNCVKPQEVFLVLVEIGVQASGYESVCFLGVGTKNTCELIQADKLQVSQIFDT